MRLEDTRGNTDCDPGDVCPAALLLPLSDVSLPDPDVHLPAGPVPGPEAGEAVGSREDVTGGDEGPATEILRLGSVGVDEGDHEGELALA